MNTTSRKKLSNETIIHLFPEKFVKDKLAKNQTQQENFEETVSKKRQKSVWARLIQKIFEVNPLICLHCGSEMIIKTFIFDKESLTRIINWLQEKNKQSEESGKPSPLKKLMKAG